MVEDEVARPSNSPWAHNVILVKKKDCRLQRAEQGILASVSFWPLLIIKLVARVVSAHLIIC